MSEMKRQLLQPRHPRGVRRARRARRGVSSLLAMLYITLFGILALGFYAASTIAAQVSRNDRQISESQLVAESGMQFIRYQLGCIIIPAGTTPEETFSKVYSELSRRLDGTRNVNGESIGYATNSIAVPGGDRWVELNDRGAAFKAIIVPEGQRLRVKVTGRSSDQARAALSGVQMEFAVAQNASKIFDFGVASRSAIRLNSNARIRGATNETLGSVMSTTSAVPSLVLEGNATISGDVTFASHIPGQLVMSGNATISDYNRDDPKLPEHIHVEEREPEFPTIDTTAFEPFATNVLSEVGKKYDSGTLKNIRIKAGTNPIFDNNIEVQGVIYVETPNKVFFGSNSIVRGAIVVQNYPTGDLSTNSITFDSNTKLYSMETLPDTPDFPPAMRALSGAMILAPKFTLRFNSAFGAVGGSIIADRLHFDSNASGTITGSVIGLSDELMLMDGNADIQILSRGTTAYPAGVFFGSHFAALADTYKEVQP